MEKKQIYIFLDVDGVLNNEASAKLSSKQIYDLSAENTIRFQDLINIMQVRYSPTIVLSSSWRYTSNGVNVLKKHLAQYNLHIDDVLDLRRLSCRGEEIKSYCQNHGIIKESVLILDDDSDMGDMADRHIKTYVRDGLTYREVEQSLILIGLKDMVWKPERYR